MPNAPKPTRIEIDDVWLARWAEYGIAELVIYLVKHAQFDAWLIAHNR